jgi:hypothetical protein
MASPLTALRLESLVAIIAIDEAACVQTIGLRIHIWSFDEGNASSRSSNPKVLLRGFSPHTPPSTILSISSVI